MKKLFFLLSLFCLFASKTEGFYMEVLPRVGAFIPCGHSGKELFPKTVPIYQLETAFHFSNPWECAPWKVFTNLGFTIENSRPGGARGHAKFFPISFGLKHSWMLDYYGELYLGAGLTYNCLWWKGNFHNVFQHFVKKQVGGVIKSGYHFRVLGCILVDLFADLYIVNYKVKEHDPEKIGKREHHPINLSGFAVGGGAGFTF